MVHTGIHTYEEFISQDRTGKIWLVKVVDGNFVMHFAARIDSEESISIGGSLFKDYTGEVYVIDSRGRLIGMGDKKTQFTPEITDVWEMDDSEFREIQNTSADIESEQDELTGRYHDDMRAVVDRHDVLSVLNHRCE